MNIQTLLIGLLNFLNETIVPFLLAIAFLVFIWNATRYFIIGGSSSEEQEKARSLALWGITAFVVMVSMWGIVNILVSGLGLNDNPIIPDYMCEKLGGSCIPSGFNDFGDPNPSVTFPTSA